MREEGRRRFYAADAAGLAVIDSWLDHYRHFWTDRLDALGRHLDRKAAARRKQAP
ncbi:MAG: hypothetical protein AAGD32_08310 [Planctomycetota bacterium]